MKEISKLRQKIHRLVIKKKKSLSDPEILETSRQLDRKIVEYHRGK
ncbi:MAG: aspartyl-phosphate phosphatase Spo0E family protein [Halanaerobium sp.]|nr:aspartyl-phosphate phosphatase Spo0E family protein [Halanaerobium sp.]